MAIGGKSSGSSGAVKYEGAHLEMTAKSSAWGDKEVYVRAFYGYAALSKVYEYSVVIESDENISTIGEQVNVAGKLFSYVFNVEGYINNVDMYIEAGRQFYKITFSSKLHSLAFSGKPRIFSKKSSEEIIKTICDLHAVTFTNKAKLSEPKREYCVQYNQTDLEFVDSILAESGALYAYKVGKSGAELIIFNDVADLKLDEPEIFHFKRTKQSDLYLVLDATLSHTYTAMGYETEFNNFQTASKAAKIKSSETADLNNKLFKKTNTMYYSNLGHLNLETKELTDAALNVQMQANLMKSKILSIRVMKYIPVGTIFQVQWPSASGKYVAIEVRHTYTSSDYANAFESYTDITAVETSLTLATKLQDKPVIPGVHRGVVVGKDGKDTETDQWGRVNVRFYWSEEFEKNKKDIENTCLVRSSHAGSITNGTYYTPRIGDEVLVAFENGDPERPYIINTLYNSLNPIKHDPSKHDINYWRMSKTEDKEKYNELSFDADKDDGKISLNAFNDYCSTVERHWVESINKGNYTHVHKEGDASITQEKGMYTYTNKEGNYTQTLEKGDYTQTLVKGNVVKSADGNYEESITGTYKLIIDKERTTMITKKDTLNIDGGSEITIADGQKVTISSKDYVIEVSSGSLTIKASDTISFEAETIKFKATDFKVQSTNIDMNADSACNMKSATFKAEGQDMQLKGSTFKAEGMSVDINASASMTVKSSASLQIEGGAMAEVKGGAMLTLSGAMVSIG